VEGRSPSIDPAVAPVSPPLWLPILAGLPITLCMVVMALPDLGRAHSAAYRALYLAAYVVWSLPLTLLQRRLWQRRVSWWKTATLLLVVTYLLSLINNAIALSMAVGWGQVPAYRLRMIFSGLDGCWLALIAFCAIHAVVAYYTELRYAEERTERAISHARDAELRALRYQLHPHFLFNTLNAISALVASQRNREANRMIARLGDFLRATLESSAAHEVALADELALTQAYLDVEKARLGERLQVRLHLGPELMGALVPYLLLQPLVENAIRHGIAPRTEPGSLDIQAFRDGGRLCLRVANEGCRSDESEKPANADHSLAIGLRNVRERLENLYPGNHRFASEAREDGHYTVVIDIPFREAEASAAPLDVVR
jgi:two-component system sensor histidine kinase AlgZ